MTPADYAKRYGFSRLAVYHAIYDGRVQGVRTEAGWDLIDVPPISRSTIRDEDELYDLPDYVFSLLWYNATISGDAILVRNKDAYAPSTIGRYLRGSEFCARRRTCDAYVLKITGVRLVAALRELGFSGRKDTDRLPPPVDPMAAAQALLETHGMFGWQLCYSHRYPRDKRYAFYRPKVGVSGSDAVVQAFADALHDARLIPERRLDSCANGASRYLFITSAAQLAAVGDAFAGAEPRHTDFWERYGKHIAHPIISYDQYHISRTGGDIL